MSTGRDKPRLRKVERLNLQRGDEALLVLRDPTGLSEQVAFPQEASVVLDALDGQRTVPQIRQSLAMRGILDIELADLEAMVRDLEAAGYLDDAAFRARWEAIHREFLASPVRRPRWAGLLYPDDPAALAELLAAGIPDPSTRFTDTGPALGVLLPHQPLPGPGAPADAATRAAASLCDEVLRGLPRARDIDLVVVLGTDYHPGLQPFVITDKRYATPRGELQSDPALVRALDRRLPWIRREEIRHREAMSLELAAAVLQHLYDGTCPPVLPVLCGPGAIEARRGRPGRGLPRHHGTCPRGQARAVVGDRRARARGSGVRPARADEGPRRGADGPRPGRPRRPRRRPARPARPLLQGRPGPRPAERHRGAADRGAPVPRRLRGRARRLRGRPTGRRRRGLDRPRRRPLHPPGRRRRRRLHAFEPASRMICSTACSTVSGIRPCGSTEAWAASP
ncbi:AmmeMemoRadiSam system protein B [Nannocystis pusilla]|uniref:AmmeMemoRadiSam system protein B n=1 Tax=Nannocystis pusilla TaxID=889268 RepID=UPI003DA60A89